MISQKGLIGLEQAKWLIKFSRVAYGWDGYLSRNRNIDGILRPGPWFTIDEWDGQPYDYRTIADNELVFDIDSKRWCDVATEARAIMETLESMDVPYIMAYSGGKGIHFHIFLEARGFEYVLTWSEIKRYLFNLILNKAGSKNARFVDHVFKTKKRQLIRDFGGFKYTYKAYIEIVPRNRPYTMTPGFPPEVRKWKIPYEIFDNMKYVLIDEKELDKLEIPYYYEPYGDNPEWPPRAHALKYTDRNKVRSIVMGRKNVAKKV